jgi:hypothetical protein
MVVFHVKYMPRTYNTQAGGSPEPCTQTRGPTQCFASLIIPELFVSKKVLLFFKEKLAVLFPY